MSHGHDEHGSAAHGAPVPSGVHGSAEMPPEPAVRTISPAGADLPFPLPGPGILWPVAWLGVAFVLWWGANRTKGEILTPHADAEHGAPHGEK